MRVLLLAAFLSLTTCLASAAPPPPPPEYIAEASKILTAPLTKENFRSYEAIFADDIRVFLDGYEVAASKAAWTTLQRALLGKVDRRVIGYSQGADNIFIVDQYDNRSTLPDAPKLVFDARYVSRAERYQFGADHLIHQVNIVQGGGMPWRSGG